MWKRTPGLLRLFGQTEKCVTIGNEVEKNNVKIIKMVGGFSLLLMNWVCHAQTATSIKFGGTSWFKFKRIILRPEKEMPFNWYLQK